jgi:tetratricopeptide (TPR) repeat protein
MNEKIRTLFLWLVLISLVLALSCARTERLLPVLQEAPPPLMESDTEQDDLQKAYASYALACLAEIDGRYPEAEDLLREALQRDKSSPYLVLKLSEILAKSGSMQDALAEAQRAVSLDPGDPMAREFLAQLYSQLQEFELAIAQYRKILSGDPDNKDVRLQLVTLLIRSKDYEGALDELSILTQREPGSIIGHYYEGKINLELKEYDKAERAFQRVLKLNESFLPALFDLAALYATSGKPDMAAETYQRILVSDPSEMTARERLIALYYKMGQKDLAEKHLREMKELIGPGNEQRRRLGLLYLRYGKLKESIDELTAIVSAWPNDEEARYYLAAALEESEDLDEAYRKFDLVAAGSDYFVNARVHMAYILEKQEKTGEAIELLRQTITQTSEHPPQLYLVLASLYEIREEHESAIGALREGLQYNNENTDLYYRLGIILGKLKRIDESIKQMETVIEIDPRHADALNYIGYTYADENIHLDRALEFIEKAIKYKPNSGYIIDSLGWVYFRKGLYDKALTELKKAVELAPHDPAIAEHLGDVYYKKQEYGNALKAYEKAISLENVETERLQGKIKNTREQLNSRSQ